MPMTTATGAQALTEELVKLGNELLSLIEIEEARLLNWGFIQGSLDLRGQLPVLMTKLPPSAQALWQTLQGHGYAVEHLLDSLAKRQLVFRLENGAYRTRFAETVRLLFLLRQRFSHLDWATAPRLVSDLKLELQRRAYPKRDISQLELETQLETQSLSLIQLAVIRRLLQNTDGSSLTLARFQADAVERQLVNLQESRDRGLVIGAGTGAGKTKAFYIPAFAHIAEAIDPHRPHLQALAIYPRNELLKDQLAEAFAEARKLDSLLSDHGKRPITIGAYFGYTPESAGEFQRNGARYRGWSLTDDHRGYVCPYFACPNDSNHVLVWEMADLEAEIADNRNRHFGRHARLRCISCDYETFPGQLALTRQQMRAAPPDILFTSTEMLNRRLSSTDDHALFGVRQANPPRLMLLDEIHTYEGITGAQTAYLLRRWRHARGQRPGNNLCIVGLSATLTDAAQFFARLTGIPEYDIDYLTPQDDDLLEEGMEYNLVLKGDPVSGASLLATSIQAAMLMGRVLDPLHRSISLGAYGQRMFAFTDKLDVINRWYQSMYDAESNKHLSQYRQSLAEGLPPIVLRREQGQVWEICERLGHELTQPLPMSRTTSQDPGVSANTSLVIATSTLEVGFNDARVGAVLQHKAPRSMASFLQRKGRAGRVRGMRPWTLVATSAYGRDRWAFQHAEALFNPILPPIDLPVENYYVRKIQAAYALLDWAAYKLGETNQNVYVWQLLSSSSNSDRSSYHRENRARLRNLLLDVLVGGQRADFERYLQRALQMDPGDPAFHNLLWGEPRALYYEVIPTLLRQLETNWRKLTSLGEEGWGDYTAAYPMPDFVPSTLFGDLNLPEVQLRLPSAGTGASENDIRPMPIAQAIAEFAPGRANKRFVTQYHRDVAHWMALPDAAQMTRGILNLAFLDIVFDEVPMCVDHQGVEYKVYRPRIYTLNELPKTIRSTAYAEMIWRTQIDIPAQHIAAISPQAPLSACNPWSRLLLAMESYTQATGTWVEITRFAIGVNIDMRYKTGENDRRRLVFEDEDGDSNTGIGFTVSADALRFSLAPLDLNELRSSPEWPSLYRHFGPAYFRHRLQHDQRLYEANLSIFAIDWLWQLEMSMLTATATSRGCMLAEAATTVNANRRAIADRSLRAIFQSQLIAHDQTFEDADDLELIGRLHTQLLDYMENDAVVAGLNAAAQALWDDRVAGLDEWLQECYTSSVGATLLAALTRLVPDIDPDELALDIDGHTVWISETAAGGVGHISKLTEVITQHPRRFELQLNDVVQHCERAAIANHLRRVAQLVSQGDTDLLEAFAAIRATVDLPSLVAVKTRLDQTLRHHGIPPIRSLVVSLNTKFLRPNSGPDSDKLVADMVEAWEGEEERLGTAIDLRVMAVAARRIPAIESQVMQLLTRINPGKAAPDENQIFNLLQSLLWLDCQDSCPECIETWQPYQSLTHPSRALLAILLTSEQSVIHYGAPHWYIDAQEALANHHQVQIRCMPDQITICKAELASFLTSPLEIGYQTFYPIVERIVRQEGHWIVQLVVHELVGA